MKSSIGVLLASLATLAYANVAEVGSSGLKMEHPKQVDNFQVSMDLNNPKSMVGYKMLTKFKIDTKNAYVGLEINGASTQAVFGIEGANVKPIGRIHCMPIAEGAICHQPVQKDSVKFVVEKGNGNNSNQWKASMLDKNDKHMPLGCIDIGTDSTISGHFMDSLQYEKLEGNIECSKIPNAEVQWGAITSGNGSGGAWLDDSQNEESDIEPLDCGHDELQVTMESGGSVVKMTAIRPNKQ